MSWLALPRRTKPPRYAHNKAYQSPAKRGAQDSQKSYRVDDSGCLLVDGDAPDTPPDAPGPPGMLMRELARSSKEEDKE